MSRSEQQRRIADDPKLQSRPLDLATLDARLQVVSHESDSDGITSRQAGRQATDSSTPPFTEADRIAAARERELKAYHKLVADGGRPVYPLERLYEVSVRPEEYSNILQPWEGHFGHLGRLWHCPDSCSGNSWEVFGRQWLRWKDFRKWQRDNRDLEDDDGGFPVFLEKFKDRVKRFWRKSAVQAELARIDADMSGMKRMWDERQSLRAVQRYYCHEFGCDGTLTDYTDAARRRLARHNFHFTRPFRFHQDLGEQDQRATWIEYLYYECWWLDRITRKIERATPIHDKGWQKLMDAKVVHSSETYEALRDMSRRCRNVSEQEWAQDRVKRAQETLDQVADQSQTSESGSSQKKEAAAAALEAAQSLWQSIKTRNECIAEYLSSAHAFQTSQKDFKRHRSLLSWIRDQIRLIEAEHEQTKLATTDCRKGTRGTKRRHESEEDDSPERSVKKPVLSNDAAGPMRVGEQAHDVPESHAEISASARNG